MGKLDKGTFTRTIRRWQLKEMVPLADSTIFGMEQRGEFPRRFALSSRCVVWDLAEVEAWLASRRARPAVARAHRRARATARTPRVGRFSLAAALAASRP